MWSVGMSSSYSLKNLFDNVGKKQMIGFLLAGAVIVILLVVLTMLLSSNSVSDEKEQDGGDEVTQNETLVSTEYNPEHEYTLSDYLPWTYYEYLEDRSGVDVKYDIVENTAIPKGIVVTINGCDEENNRLSANKYLGTLPIEPGEYEITYIVKGCERKY